MPIRVEPYGSGHEQSVRAFNQRLEAGGCPFRFPESFQPTWLPKEAEEPIYEEFYVAVEGESVRGGYVLKRQPFYLAGQNMEVGCVILPLSEGVVAARFSGVAVLLLADALKRQSRLYSLGMGGFHQTYPRLLKAAGWSLAAVPFYLRVLNPAAFLNQCSALRTWLPARIGLDLLAVTGLGWLGIKAGNALLELGAAPDEAVTAEEVCGFGDWADRVWMQGRDHYALSAIRDMHSLNRLYPQRKTRYLKLKISRRAAPIGWAVMLDTVMNAHKQFGHMRVGSIIDCFAVPGAENSVVRGATRLLEDRGVDIIVSNQSHRDWRAALTRAGYWRAPSNYILAASPGLGRGIAPFEPNTSRIHFTRGDGEGPSHL